MKNFRIQNGCHNCRWGEKHGFRATERVCRSPGVKDKLGEYGQPLVVPHGICDAWADKGAMGFFG